MGLVLGLLLGACAQAPEPRPGDPTYTVLAPGAEVVARSTVQTALETAHSKTSLAWTYVQDGSKGEVTPLRTYRTTTGYYCRDYVEVVETLGSGRAERRRTACRDNDGTWKPIGS